MTAKDVAVAGGRRGRRSRGGAVSERCRRVSRVRYRRHWAWSGVSCCKYLSCYLQKRERTEISTDNNQYPAHGGGRMTSGEFCSDPASRTCIYTGCTVNMTSLLKKNTCFQMRICFYLDVLKREGRVLVWWPPKNAFWIVTHVPEKKKYVKLKLFFIPFVEHSGQNNAELPLISLRPVLIFL